jgi:pyruvate-formate lyase-activating enzyme
MNQRILCLGNNTEDTDVKTRSLAAAQVLCHGLLSDLDGTVTVDSIQDRGYYHTSVYDIEYGKLIDLAEHFDTVIVLDQPRDQYSHPDAFYKTIRLARELRSRTQVILLDPTYETDIDFFENLVQTNTSFCIFPFIELLTNQRDDGQTTVCCRSTTPITHVDQILDFATDKNYKIIRDKMLQGVPVPEHCSTCYALEDKNIRSARQQETVEWANRLGISSLKDLSTITHPAYYEIRPSNICNLQCRMCSPGASQLIGKEYLDLDIISKLPPAQRSDFSIVDFTNLKKLYVAGGEPTAMPEFYDFLDRCIDENRVFEFLVNTNGTKLNNRFKKQLKCLPHMQFTVSIDGFDQLNHYIRWPSNWSVIIDNIRYLVDHGHIVAINTTVSIYNVIELHKLFAWLDKSFPGILIHAALAGSDDDILSALRFPDSRLAKDRLLPIKQLNCYNNDGLLKSTIDGLISYYDSDPIQDQQKLRQFFEFNDKLDRSRNIQLVDYVPELEQARHERRH